MYIAGTARYFTQVLSINHVRKALQFAHERKLRYFVLGGGSNVLISDTGFDGLIIHIGICGKQVVSQSEDHVEFEVGAGENWDDFVAFTVDKGLYGIENLSHI